MTTVLERGASDKKDIRVSFDWHVASNEESFSYFCLRFRDVAVDWLALLLHRSFDSRSEDRQYVLGFFVSFSSVPPGNAERDFALYSLFA
jgi:hypothetical protein